jgi:hypothetical protein
LEKKNMTYYSTGALPRFDVPQICRVVITRRNAPRVDPRFRSNSVKSCLAMLAASALVASLPWARALAGCQAPTNTFLNPFTKESAHHRPIGSGAVYAGRNHPTTKALLQVGFANINADNGWGNNVYQSKTSDPWKTVQRVGPYPGQLPFPFTLRVPVGANNHDTSDAQILVVEPNTINAHEFYRWRWNGGNPTASFRTTWKTNGLGHGSRMGASASGLPALFGLIRGHEVNVPGYKMQHVFTVALPHKFKGCRVDMFDNRAVWPATSIDTFCVNNPSLCPGPIPYGALLALPPSANVAGLGLSEPGKRMAEALRNYGAYTVDSSDCPTMRADQYVTPANVNAIRSDMRKLYPLLQMVLNNEKDQTASGGGTPRAENCAFDSPDR